MQNLEFTPHARCRMAQRNYFENDLALMLRFGTETPDGIMLLHAAYHEALAEAERVKRLIGSFVVIEDGVVRSIQRLNKSKAHRKLRSAKWDR
jgi:hypothetical protein